MTEVPKVIWARPVGATNNWDNAVSGPWSMSDPYGTATRYIRADAPELLALVEAANRLVCNPEWGTVKYTDDGMWRDGDILKQALAKWEELTK